jgi:galactokinase/mevalonate kinase-like predicted kinase
MNGSRPSLGMNNIPYRLDLAGGWLDQPFVSGLCPGWVITISLEPIVEYSERSGMATSTRKAIQEVYQLGLPKMDSIEMAKLVFNLENKPGNKEVSGAQDAIGICVKGLSRYYYNGKYWPQRIEICQDEEILDWLESVIFLRHLGERPQGLDLLKKTDISYENVGSLSYWSDKCWESIFNKNLSCFADTINYTFIYQCYMFPAMAVYEKPKALGFKLAGAGGGGYLVMINDTAPENSLPIKIRR